MEIWIVERLVDDEYFIYGFEKAFSSEEKAQAYIDNQPGDKYVEHWDDSGRKFKTFIKSCHIVE